MYTCQAHTYIHTCIHTRYIHIYIHTYIHVNIPDTYIYTYIHIHTYVPPFLTEGGKWPMLRYHNKGHVVLGTFFSVARCHSREWHPRSFRSHASVLFNSLDDVNTKRDNMVIYTLHHKNRGTCFCPFRQWVRYRVTRASKIVYDSLVWSYDSMIAQTRWWNWGYPLNQLLQRKVVAAVDHLSARWHRGALERS